MDSVNHTDSGDIQILFQFLLFQFLNCVAPHFPVILTVKWYPLVNHYLRLMSETSRVFNRLKQTATKIRDSDEGNRSQVSKRKPDLTRV